MEEIPEVGRAHLRGHCNFHAQPNMAAEQTAKEMDSALARKKKFSHSDSSLVFQLEIDFWQRYICNAIEQEVIHR